ncbi:MAG: penicillin-binding transpeptidase domain-containing protein [Solirubrobacterales bacterium]
MPIVAVAVVAFVVGVVVAAGDSAPGAHRFLDAWEQADIQAMYDELTPGAQDHYSLPAFRRAYDDAMATATIDSVDVGETHEVDGGLAATVSFPTSSFGNLSGELTLPVDDGKVDWSPELVYPGLQEGERLSRRTRAPQRAAILAADRSPLAKGPASARSVSTAALAVAGEVGTPDKREAAEITADGFPPGSLTGISGLELAFNDRLSGKPGGQLLAVSANEENQIGGGRVLASTQPVPGKPVRTNIDPDLQQEAVTALGATYGGVAVLDAKKGSVLAMAGLAYSAPQPPGSTFKIITTTGALDAGIVKLSDTFPVESSNSDIGREVANAHDELCGGTFSEAFAESCNTVFAPLGAELGGDKLVATAEAYGFNAPPTLFNDAATKAVDAPESTIPTDLDGDSVEVGVSAIGQGEVQATPLEMAAVAQAVANGGTRLPNSIAREPQLQPDTGPVEVTSHETADTLRELMIGVVEHGTGVAAQLPNVQVAGKTGTAELGPKPGAPAPAPGEQPEQATDAWFTCFAPASDPKIVVAVMVVNSDGDGGTVAAPIARQVLESYFGTA